MTQQDLPLANNDCEGLELERTIEVTDFIESLCSTIISGKPTCTESITLEEAEEEVGVDQDFHLHRVRIPDALPS